MLIIALVFPSAKMPMVKLVYFDAQAKGELTRLLLAAGNIDYEDFRFGFADWPGQLKAKTPFGQVMIALNCNM